MVVDLHAKLTRLLQFGSVPSQAKQIATFSNISVAVAGSISMQEMAVFASYFGANQHIGGKTGKEGGFSG
jgi:hypothetical protein